MGKKLFNKKRFNKRFLFWGLFSFILVFGILLFIFSYPYRCYKELSKMEHNFSELDKTDNISEKKQTKDTIKTNTENKNTKQKSYDTITSFKNDSGSPKKDSERISGTPSPSKKSKSAGHADQSKSGTIYIDGKGTIETGPDKVPGAINGSQEDGLVAYIPEKSGSKYEGRGTMPGTAGFTGKQSYQNNTSDYDISKTYNTTGPKNAGDVLAPNESENQNEGEKQQDLDYPDPTPSREPLNPTPWSLEFICRVMDAKPGDELLAFNPRGILCGRASLKGDGTHDGFLHVYIDDVDTEREEGLKIGDEIIFKVGDKQVFLVEKDNIVYDGGWGSIEEIILGR